MVLMFTTDLVYGALLEVSCLSRPGSATHIKIHFSLSVSSSYTQRGESSRDELMTGDERKTGDEIMGKKMFCTSKGGEGGAGGVGYDFVVQAR